MSVKVLISLVGLSVLLAGCSTGRYAGVSDGTQANNLSPTEQGMRYRLGHGVPQNNIVAFSYFNEAASRDPVAENELGYMYAAGVGTEKNDEKAFHYYQRAAKHGIASAQYNLGLLYLHGIGTEADRTMAIEWFKKSAAQGFEPAKLALTRYPA